MKIFEHLKILFEKTNQQIYKSGLLITGNPVARKQAIYQALHKQTFDIYKYVDICNALNITLTATLPTGEQVQINDLKNDTNKE